MDRLFVEFRWDELRKRAMPTWARRAALQNLPQPWPWLNAFDCDHTSAEFSEKTGVLNGTNSGLCAFNLAYQMRPKHIHLFGFDMKRGPQGQPYWYPPYGWRPEGGTSGGRYREWSGQFKTAARLCKAAGIEVTVVGDSAIDCFRKVSASEFSRAA